MAQIVLLFKKTNVTLGAITLDASLRETHKADVETTDYPVETGVDITDHARPKPRLLTIEGVVTNTPLTQDASITNDLVDSTGTVIGNFTSQGEIQPGLAEKAYADLIDLYLNGTLITVTTALAVYPSMLLTTLEVPRDAHSGQALFFTATFKQVTLAQSQVVQVKRPAKSKGNGNANVAKKPLGPVPNPVGPSIAVQAADATGLTKVLGL